MKRSGWKLALLAVTGVTLVFLVSRTSNALDTRPTPELLKQGKGLFYQTKDKLGAKFNCILCHQKEKAIKHVEAVKLGDKLPDVINAHLVEKSKGKPLAKDSQEMKALTVYILNEHSI